MIDLEQDLGIRALALDLDGTLYDSGRPIAGAIDAVARLRANGVPLRFVTNTTSRCRAAVAGRLRRIGFQVNEEEIVSPPHAAGEFLRERGQSAALFVRDATLPDFHGVAAAARPDWVVVGDLGEAWTWQRMNEAFRLLLEGGASLLALGRTRYWRDAGALWMDAGPIVAALEYASGARTEVIGKPAPAFFAAVVRALGVAPNEVALVGDDIRTDVGAAQRAGLRGFLVRTGKFRPQDLQGETVPDLVLPSVAALA